MSSHPLPACGRALASLALAAAALFASGCVKAPSAQPDARLDVAATALIGPYQPGDNIAFRLTVTNVGTQDATNVTITSTLGADVHERSLICSPLGLSAWHAGNEDCHDSVYLLKLAKGA